MILLRIFAIALGGFFFAMTSFAIVDFIPISFFSTKEGYVSDAGNIFVVIGGLVGCVVAGLLWGSWQRKTDAKLPWNKKRQGGPILPGASPQFLNQVQERTAAYDAAMRGHK